jgi:DNA-binding beta-propeller fold protein YncE
MRKNHAWAVLALTALVGLSACGDDSGGGQTSGGGTQSTSHAIGDPAIKSAVVVAQTDQSAMPLDAAPSPDGAVVYYITTGDGGSVLSSVPAAGGSATTIVQGAPLVKPTGVAVATDGSRVFVADQQALQDSVAGVSGGVLQVSTTGPPAPTLLAGTEGRSPRGLDVVSEGGADIVYFTGLDPANGTPGLFRVPVAGGSVTTVAEGAPFVSPDSVVVTAGGVAYVTDQGSGQGKGEVLKVSDGKATPVLPDLRLGSPAGVTTVNDDATLLVSSIDAASLSDQVLFLDVATGKTAAATKVIGANKDSAGGLHRAHTAPVLAWADVSRGGRVYRVDF